MTNKFTYSLEDQAHNQALSKKEEKIWQNIKIVVAIAFFIALIGAALDLLV